jgi:phosphoglycolate phosphatase
MWQAIFVLTLRNHTPLAVLLSPIHSRIEAIIFDKDGTLADAAPFLRELAIARAKACAEALFQTSSDHFRGYYDALCTAFGVIPEGLEPNGLMAVGTKTANEQSAVALFVERGGNWDQGQRLVSQIFKQVDGAVALKAAQTPPFVGTGAMLLQLGQSPLKVGVLSSDTTAHVVEFLDHYGLIQCVDAWRGTEPGDKAKPHPDLFWELCDCLQIQPQHTLMVGDSWADLEVARNAGAAAFVSVGEGWGRSPVPGADLVMSHWSDLLDIAIGSDERPSVSQAVHPADEELSAL